ncbi:MAG: response regulator [Bacteroidales bacterium]|nr:response regulator [Bacteroidales bacterium]
MAFIKKNIQCKQLRSIIKTATVIILVCYHSVLNIQARNTNYNFGHIDYTDGLSHNRVICTLKDSSGFIWFGTVSGLNRFDGYSFKIFKNNPFDTLSLPDNVIQSLTLDQKGRIWIEGQQFYIFDPVKETFTKSLSVSTEEHKITFQNVSGVLPVGDSIVWLNCPEYGLIKYNIISNKRRLITHSIKDSASIYSTQITGMDKDNSGNLWVIHRNLIIEKIGLETDKVANRIFALQGLLPADEGTNYELYIDNTSGIWVYSSNKAYGLYYIDKKGKLTEHYSGKSKKFKLNSDVITNIVQDSDGKIWVGTDHGGINIIDKKYGTVDYQKHDPEDEYSISQDVITNLYRDSQGIIWASTYKQGVNFYHPDLYKFKHYAHHPSDPKSLSYDDVNCFVEDMKSNLWIGTNGQGLIYFDRKKEEFINYRHHNNDLNSLSNDVIVSLYIDNDGNLWIGTYHGGLNLYNGKYFKTFLHDPENNKSISDNRVWEIYEDSEHNLWIGTLGGGLDRFDRSSEVFYHYSGNDISSIRSNFVIDMEEDREGNLWVGTDNGIFIIDWQTGRISHLSQSVNNPQSLSHNVVFALKKDNRGNMWAGTRDGLNLYDENTNAFVKFGVENGLAENSILSIIESDMGDLWISTSNGLSKMTVIFNDDEEYENHFITNFNESDGLQSREFNEGAAYKTRKGELIFGGPNGFNIFNPEDIDAFTKTLDIYILGLHIFGEQVDVGKEIHGRKILDQNLLNNKKLRLKFKENIFSFEFAALDYLNPRKIKYRYKLEGFNDQWLYTDWNNRLATYTNLNPGKYQFIVQASESGDNWQLAEAGIQIIIKPPYYRSIVAYMIYALIVTGLLLLFRSSLLYRERMRFQKEQAVLESNRQHELNILKTRFFTNVSHEFRTPLTLVLTPLEKLIKSNRDPVTGGQLGIIYQNAKRLLNLVNQLLDFRKLEENRLTVNYSYGNVIGFIERTISSFTELAESKNVSLYQQHEISEVFMQFDRDKLEKIIFNLLSNAFKFTPENGNVEVKTHIEKKPDKKENLYIEVIDSGIGIPEDRQEKVFERFYQSNLPSAMISKGSGIGLSLTRDFVRLLGGEITLTSKEGEGSRFTIVLPVNRDIVQLQEDDDVKTIFQFGRYRSVSFNKDQVVNKKTILLVEDNDEFRTYLRDNLSSKFNIAEAPNGKIALDNIEQIHPDLIVSDIMMPEVDGYEFCKKIKTNTNTSHIPVILLTARTEVNDKIEGYNLGADEYLVKPFNFEILESRINYLIEQRQKFIQTYQKTFKIEPNAVGITSLDEKLMNKALKYVEDNIAESELSVERLSSHLAMSRVNLYKKMISLTGKSPVEFIRLVRLKRAAQLLKRSQLSVSEIAYQVGFSDPRYFSKHFKAEFKTLPSKYKAGA